MSRQNISMLFALALVSALLSSVATYLVMGSSHKDSGGSLARVDDAAAQDFVRRALLGRPEMLNEAIDALRAGQRQNEEKQRQAVIDENETTLFADKNAAYIGAENPKLVLVEFFDYNCGFCKIASKWVRKALADHPDDVRLYLRDHPILENSKNGSLLASMTALAAREQGKELFQKYHFKLMDTKGGFDAARLDKLAAEVGLDVQKLHQDMEKLRSKNAKTLTDNYDLAMKLRIAGTPAFLSKDAFVNGADTDKLQSLLDAALK